jgi:hypothetical protein
MIKQYWRLLRDKDGLPTTLFHGVCGSRKLPLDQWIDAEIKTVTDGNRKTATEYVSGFHVMSYDDIIKFKRRFKKLDDLVIAEVDIDTKQGLWEKEHSPANILLAGRMRIRSQCWGKRLWVKEL